MDETLFRALNQAGWHPLADWSAVMLHHVGASWLWLVPAMALVVGARHLALPAWRIVGVAVVVAASFTWAINEVLKGLVGRPRPPFVLEGVRLVIEPGTSYAFPSGHAMVAFACAVCVAVAIRGRPRQGGPSTPAWVGAVLLALAAAVALSRVYLGLHWPSDVLAGSLFGSVLGWAAWVAVGALSGSQGPSAPPPMRRAIGR